MSINAARLEKLQITLSTPVVLDAYEYRNNNIIPISSFITFPKGTVFSRLRKEGGYISGISSEIAGKRYFVYSIPRAEHLTMHRNDQQFVGYFHGGKKNTRKNKRNRKTTRRSN